MKYQLPEPSGEVEYIPHLTNSYGTKGCYRVGGDEIENPIEDVQYGAQYLANALAALAYEDRVRFDRLAHLARSAYYRIEPEDNWVTQWDDLGPDYQERWRNTVRAVLNAAK